MKFLKLMSQITPASKPVPHLSRFSLVKSLLCVWFEQFSPIRAPREKVLSGDEVSKKSLASAELAQMANKDIVRAYLILFIKKRIKNYWVKLIKKVRI